MTTFNLSVFGDELSSGNCLVSIEIPERTERIIEGNIEGHHYESPKRLISLRNIAFPPGCDVDPSALSHFHSLITGLFPNHIIDDTDQADNYRQMLDLLRIRFEGLSIHKECYYQTFQDNEAVMRNLRREINPWTTRDSTIIGSLNLTGKMQDCLGMTPLHILACSTRHTLEMYELIVQKYPENLITRDKWGDVPLLYACWCNAPDEIVQFLVESFKTRYPGYTFDWGSMIETLAKNDVPTSRVQALIEIQQHNFADQECNLEDVIARLVRPFHPPPTYEIKRFLLREIFSRQIEAYGVGRWLIEFMDAINNICRCGEEYHLTRKLYSLLDQCESLKESAGILELALWKAKLEDDDKHCHKMRKVNDDCTTVARRERCRINCGADIVLRNVLLYLSPIMN